MTNARAPLKLSLYIYVHRWMEMLRCRLKTQSSQGSMPHFIHIRKVEAQRKLTRMHAGHQGKL